MKKLQALQLKGFPNIFDTGILSKTNASALNVQEGSIFIVMQKLTLSLHDVRLGQPFKIDQNDVYKFGIELVDILERLHSAGVCHNDLKPDNIMLDIVDGKHELYLIDFGTATKFLD